MVQTAVKGDWNFLHREHSDKSVISILVIMRPGFCAAIWDVILKGLKELIQFRKSCRGLDTTHSANSE